MLRVIILFFGIMIVAGCSNPLGSNKSFVDSLFGPKITETTEAGPVAAAAGTEVVGSSQLSMSSTSTNHKIDVTTGMSVAPIAVTTSRNRKVLLNVQGQLVNR